MTTAPYPNVDGTQPCAAAPEVWFPPKKRGRRATTARNLNLDERRAIRECDSCPFEQACLRYAVHHLVEGIWGGTTENERDQIRQAHGIVPDRLELGDHALKGEPNPVRARLDHHGLTSHQVKKWALAAGLIPEITRGTVPIALIDAYLAAHPEGTTR